MDDYVTSKITRKIKEKGYPMAEIPIGGRDNRNAPVLYDLPKEHPDWQDCKAWWVPTISQVLKWLRDEKKISIEIGIHCSLKWMCSIYAFSDGIGDFTQYDNDGINDTIYILYDSYEEAAIAGIEYTLNNLI